MTVNERRTRSDARRTRAGQACVIGGGHVGYDVAARVAASGAPVVFVDDSSLVEPPPGVTVHETASFDADLFDDVDADLFDDAGPQTTVLAMGTEDSTNLLIAQLARTNWGVDRVLVRVNDPRRTETFEALGFETVDASAALGSAIAERW